jgi:photosystem II stability/assembly factor-like uncharacterized protein
MTRILALALSLTLVSGAAAQTWMPQNSGTSNLLEAVWFTNQQDGWIVGDAGTSLFTNDGGGTWTGIVLTADDLGDVSFRDASTGLIVGDNGIVFRTVNGGITWVPVASGTGNNLLNVAFGGPGLAHASGRDGTILRSTDDGATWSLVETGATRYRSTAAQGMRAWHVGDGGAIRATADGGSTWADQTSGTTNDLHGVHFVSTTEGWIAGQNNTLLYTNDGGATWVPRNAGVLVGLDDVFFVSSTLGWVIGDAGTILRSTDGGLSWLPEASGTNVALNGMYFAGSARGWVVGDQGTVLVRIDPTAVEPIAGDATRGEAELLGNVPNPFRPSTRIRYSLPNSIDSRVVLSVHDTGGRLVRTLVDGPQPGGTHAATWDGRDESGSPAASGVYFYRLSWDGQSRVGRMVLIR